MKWSIFILVSIICFTHLSVAEQSEDNLDIDMNIPMKSKDIYDSNKLLAGATGYERAEVILSNNGDMHLSDIEVKVDIPLQMDIILPTQELKDIIIEDEKVIAKIDELKPGDSVSFIIAVIPPESVEFKKEVDFSISVKYNDYNGIHFTTYTHNVEIIPPPSWITYGTILISILILLIFCIVTWKYGFLETFTTIDLITISLLAALIGVVFRWFWQTFNDFLGPLGGLLFTIPTAVLMIIALQLVRKPGTATLLFTIVELVAMIVWGTNVTIWLGWYMSEGIIVDLLILLFKKDYGDRRITAIIYSVARSGFSYMMFYFLFAPAVWKVYYAPWYSLTEVGIACIGGLIGGAIGYDIAKQMRGAML